MEPPSTWEMLLVGVVVALALLWMAPGMKKAFQNTRQASRSEWLSVLLPVAAVVLFVLLLMALV
jgi:Tfp pilus assembly protein FimT